MILRATANKIADRTYEGAFSAERYGRTEWRKAARLMADRGFAAEQIEAVLKSKWMRWAADAAGTSRGKADHLAAYLNKNVRTLNDDLVLLVEGTFDTATALRMPRPIPEPRVATGADLAGSCEGEDIADLIDLARAIRDEASQVAPADAALAIKVLSDRATTILATIERRAK